MAEMMQLQDVLKGYIVDRENIQSVGNMTMIPIIADVEFTNVADVNDVTLKKDPAYNILEFQNVSGNIGIALQGWTMIDRKQAAQDRTIPYAHLIKGANAKLVPANCVQANQGGHFNPSAVDQDSFMVLPPSLRGLALKKSTYSSADYSALWDSLGRWVKGVDCHNNGLQMFYSKFEDKLEQFVAQFEPVEKQLGSIVLINGKLVAIDLMPKYKNWTSVWRAIIRDSYGAEAVRVIENEGAVNIHPSLDLSGINSINDLEHAYENMKSDFYDSLQNMIAQTLQTQINSTVLERAGELTMMKFDNTDFTGQGVIHGDDHYVYLSIVSSSSKPSGRRANQFQSLRNAPYSGSTFNFR